MKAGMNSAVRGGGEVKRRGGEDAEEDGELRKSEVGVRKAEWKKLKRKKERFSRKKAKKGRNYGRGFTAKAQRSLRDAKEDWKRRMGGGKMRVKIVIFL